MMKIYLITGTVLLLSLNAQAINIGNMTFSIPSDKNFVSKKIINNNRSERLYSVSIIGIDRPGQREIKTRPAGGELMFTPRKISLSAGQGDYIKFVYSGPQDDRERYYRVTFREVPLDIIHTEKTAKKAVIEPIVALESILVVRPRKQRFTWDYSEANGTLRNSGNTYFQVLIKQGCSGSDEEAESAYLRPGETLRLPSLKGNNKKFIVTDDRFIPLGRACFAPEEAPS